MQNATPSLNSNAERPAPRDSRDAAQSSHAAQTAAARSEFPQSDICFPDIRVQADRLHIAGVELPRALITDTLSDLKHMLEVLSALKAANVSPTELILQLAAKVDAENKLPEHDRVIARVDELLSTNQALEAHIYQRTKHWLELLREGSNPGLQADDIQDFVQLLRDGLAVSVYSEYVDRALLAPFSGCTTSTLKWMSLKAYVSTEAAVRCQHLYTPLFQPAFPEFVGGSFQYLINRVSPNPQDLNPDSMVGLMHLVAAREVAPNVPAPRAEVGQGKLNIHLGSDEVVTSFGTIKSSVVAEDFLVSFPLVEPLREIFFKALADKVNLFLIARCYDSSLANETGVFAGVCNQRLLWRLEDSTKKWAKITGSGQVKDLTPEEQGDLAQHLLDVSCLFTLAATVREAVFGSEKFWTERANNQSFGTEVEFATSILKNKGPFEYNLGQLAEGMANLAEFMGYSINEISRSAKKPYHSKLSPYATVMSRIVAQTPEIQAAIMQVPFN
jgi:hypothetical protein